MNLTDEQSKVRDELIQWYKNIKHEKKKKFIDYMMLSASSSNSIDEQSYNLCRAVYGSAGTGKTVLLTEFVKDLKHIIPNIRIAVLAYTGKASSVIQKKFDEAKYTNTDFIGTIHSLMYEPEYSIDLTTRKKIIIGWKKKDEIGNIDLILVDEASMVSTLVLRDLITFGIPIILFGDDKQLNPIEMASEPLTKNLYKLFSERKLVYKLETIHRQALESPIIQLSIAANQKGFVNEGVYGSEKNVFKIHWDNPKCKELFNEMKYDNETVVLCGFNKTRVSLNNKIRQNLKFKTNYPYPGDRVICLRNNNRQKIMNGMMGNLVWVFSRDDKNYSATIEMDGIEEPYSTVIPKNIFGQETYDDIWKKEEGAPRYGRVEKKDYFDYGYAISVHKSQGTEWDRVVIFEQRSRSWDEDSWRRWLYTAITRAKKKLFIITGYNDY